MPDIFSQPESGEKETPETKEGAIVAPQPHTLNLFSTFTHHPQGLILVEQEEDEQIILLLRRDFITNIPWIVTTLILLVLPAPAYGILSVLHLNVISLSAHFLLALLLFYYLIAIGFAFINYITWFYNLGIVTSKRVFRIIFSNLSTISVAAADLSDIADVEFSQHGFSQSVFDFGDVTLQIETKSKNFDFEQIPRPAQVVEIISKMTGEK